MSRDPKRVDRMLDKLGRVWRSEPELRLGQLVVNATSPHSPFLIEDEALEAKLDEYIAAGLDTSAD